MKLLRTRSFRRWWMASVAAALLVACGGTLTFDGVDSCHCQSPPLPNAFTAVLSTAEEVPPHTGNATGAAVAVIDPGSHLMRITVVPSGVAATETRIEEAPPGSTGPVAFRLAETQPGSGIWITQAILTDTRLTALQSGNDYANVTSALFPNGDVRGQLLQRPGGAATSANTAVFINAVNGAQEVPPTASAATAVGITVIDRRSNSLTAVINTIGIDGTSAQIRQQAPGARGPVVFELAQTSAASGIWVTRAMLTDTQVQLLLGGNYYFEVSSANFPAGEVRGQIVQHQQDVEFNGCGSSACGSSSSVGVGIGLGF